MQIDRFLEYTCFAEVVRRGNFTLAAEALGMSKSYVSKSITGLEARLGVSLFERTTRRVRVTEVGLDYYDRILPLLRSADIIDASVQNDRESLYGTVRVTTPIEFNLDRIVRAMVPFMKQNPAVNVSLRVSDYTVDMAVNEIDLAIRLQEGVTSIEGGLMVGATELMLVASQSYIDQFGRPMDVDALLQHNLLSYSLRRTGNFWRIQTKDGEMHRVRADGAFSADSGMALLEAAECGLGIAFLPTFIVEPSIKQGRILEIDGDFGRTPLYIHLVRRSPAGGSSRAVDAFFDFISSDDILHLWV